MARATHRIQLDGRHIDGSRSSCLGRHVTSILNVLEPLLEDITWYCADVRTNRPDASAWPAATAEVVSIGSTSDFLERVSRVDQFESGVFLALLRVGSSPNIRHDPATEDPPFSELGDAVVEMRAFDTSYIELYARGIALLEPLASRFDVDVERQDPDRG